ncbi:ATP-binding cassette domain-containing protein [Undibacterium cyanobacteriorum]|uniref:ATP-binding cassette domain-containing protein n=1 Tax=Undibacterium cyanobacteriorum TaxID=3073561 RepID=A0ABY9RKW9_9BURK|nr:ATP-binding cassette domain-containing protein [Undibacterium sp. 20NA77.5]WMW81484.1 ATP-binding cassette domain-containing protein [Undibacterium sp. 20NA77.5]
MIIVEDLHKEFIKLGKPKFGIGARQTEKVKAVNGVSFSAQDGAILGLLGANGAGKTTSLRMVASMLKMDSGSIKIDGVEVKEGQTASQAHLGILSDARGLYPRLTSRENIQYYGKLHGMEKAKIEQRLDQLAHWLEIEKLLDRRTEGFSQGERMKIALARALIHDPKNIILDEPTNGLDVVATRALREFLRWLRSPEGGSKCIVFSTHIMQEVERLCDTVVIVAQGRTVAKGTVTELMHQAQESDFEDAFVKLAFLDKSSPLNGGLHSTLKQGSVA